MIEEIIGYIASVLIIGGVFLVRKRRFALQSDIMLTLGSTGLVINSLYFGAIPAALVNVVTALLGLNNIRKDLKERKKHVK